MKKNRNFDPIVELFVNLAIKYLKPRKVILFGSRARGDSGERSDYDFAVDDYGISNQRWARFSLEVKEKVPTLKEIEIIRMSQIDGTFRERILKEGIIVYEPQAKSGKS